MTATMATNAPVTKHGFKVIMYITK